MTRETRPARNLRKANEYAAWQGPELPWEVRQARVYAAMKARVDAANPRIWEK